MSLVRFSKPVISSIEEEAMSLLALYNLLFFMRLNCLHHCCNLNPSLCCLSPFHLSHVAISSPRSLSEFYLGRASLESLARSWTELCHWYGIYRTKMQMSPIVKSPQWQRARDKSGCIHKLVQVLYFLHCNS